MKSSLRVLRVASTVTLALSLSAQAAPPSVAPSVRAESAGFVAAPAPFLRLPHTATPTRYVLDLTVRPSEDSFSGQIDITVQIAESKDVLWLHASRELTVEKTTLKTTLGELTPRVELVGKDLIALR